MSARYLISKVIFCEGFFDKYTNDIPEIYRDLMIKSQKYHIISDICKSSIHFIDVVKKYDGVIIYEKDQILQSDLFEYKNVVPEIFPGKNISTVLVNATFSGKKVDIFIKIMDIKLKLNFNNFTENKTQDNDFEMYRLPTPDNIPKVETTQEILNNSMFSSKIFEDVSDSERCVREYTMINNLMKYYPDFGKTFKIVMFTYGSGFYIARNEETPLAQPGFVYEDITAQIAQQPSILYKFPYSADGKDKMKTLSIKIFYKKRIN